MYQSLPPQAPDTPQPEASVVPQNVEKPAEGPKIAETVEELPQTGDEQDNNMATLGGTIVAGLLGLMAFFKSKKNNKTLV